MKRLLLAATAVCAVVAPFAASAQSVPYGNPGYPNYDYNRNGYYNYNRNGSYGNNYRGYSNNYGRGYDHNRRYWERGEYLPRDLRDNYVRDWRRFGLRAPSDQNNGWFAVGDQFVMANFDNGLIAMAVPRD